MMKIVVSVLVGMVLLAGQSRADEECFDQNKEYGSDANGNGLSFKSVRGACESNPAIKGRPLPVMKCIFKTGEIALNPEETFVNYPVLETLAGIFSTEAKIDFIREKLEFCKNKVNSDPAAVNPFFECCGDEIVRKCKDFEGQIVED